MYLILRSSPFGNHLSQIDFNLHLSLLGTSSLGLSDVGVLCAACVGLVFEVYRGTYDSLPNFDGLTPHAAGLGTRISLDVLTNTHRNTGEGQRTTPNGGMLDHHP